MGSVFKAEQVGLGRSVAVKLLKPENVATDLDLFRTEALAASRINHPHAIAIFDFGITQEGLPYLVMEHLRGPVLGDVIDERPLAVERVITIGAQVLSALAEAHACGVIHRDLKADNIILEPLRDGDDFAKLIDFGIARLAGGSDHIRGIAGTPAYMAPEQIRGEEATPATDLYAVGILLYEMIVGDTPFEGDYLAELLDAHLTDDPIPPIDRNPACPTALSALVLQALAKNPRLRPASARAMRDALLHTTTTREAARSCPSCGELVARAQRYCGECGHGLAASTVRRAVIPATAELEDVPTGRVPRTSPSRETRMTIQLAQRQPSPIGRDGELARLEQMIRDEGGPGAIAIVAPAAMGKARLVVSAAARAPDIPTFVSGPDPTGLKTAWYPIAGMLEAIHGTADPDVFEFGDLSPLTDRAALRRRIDDAALAALEQAAHHHPRSVLCFFDVDQYDRPSGELLIRLAQRLDGTGVRMLVTATTAGAVPPGASVGGLGPLGPADTLAVAKSLAAPDIELPDADALHAATGGSPEAIAHLVGWIAAGNGAASAPAVLVDLIAARLSLLLPAARRLLQAVAIHGIRAPRELVDATLGEANRASGEAIPELVDLGFVTVADGKLALSSELVRDVVRSTTPQDVRRELHRNALAAVGDGASIETRAHHAAGARSPDRAVSACLAAGDGAILRFDDAGAATWYARAVDVAWERQVLGDEAAQTDLIDASIKLADALRRGGQTRLSKDVLTQAMLSEPNRAQRAAISRQRARHAGSRDEAVRHLRSAIDASVAAGERGEFLCTTALELADALERSGDVEAAIDELAEVTQLVSFAEGFALRNAVPALWQLGYRRAELAMRAGRRDEAHDIALSTLDYALRTRQADAGDRVGKLLERIRDA